MIQQVTKGIKVSVITKFEGTVNRNQRHYYNFSYYITIENTTDSTVQLIKRHWEIFDSLNFKETVDGNDVVGQTPTLAPKESYTYKSCCLLVSDLGSMQGYFTMIDLETKKLFRVTIPIFQLSTKTLSN